MKEIKQAEPQTSVSPLLAGNGQRCACGRVHRTDVADILIGRDSIARLPACVQRYGAKKVFVLADSHTYAAAGERVCAALRAAGITAVPYVLPGERVEPDELAVGQAILHFDRSCQLVVGVGSGVINDIGKILSHTAGLPYAIVATAPSMDGYASATASVARDGLKISLPAKCADIIVGDLDVLRSAPMELLISGLGDMLAKYISLAEWRISHEITGEYYCETVAQMVRRSLHQCVDNADGLLRRDETAVQAVFEGLIVGGIAMNYAGLSRPASGVEHYFSHVWDMRGLEFGTPVSTHGIQCAIGTLYAARLYERLMAITPDRQRALDYVRQFSYPEYREQLRAFLGKSAETMIALEEREQKYDPARHAQRLERILNSWEDIRAIVQQEIPAAQTIETLLQRIGCPRAAAEIGIDPATLPMTFRATKDIRDKYVLSRLCWDLGVLDELCAAPVWG